MTQAANISALISVKETTGAAGEKNLRFHLHNQTLSYLLGVDHGKTLVHLGFGKRVIGDGDNLVYPRVDRGFSGNLSEDEFGDRTFSRDTVLCEYGTAGGGDFRQPASSVVRQNGATNLLLRYHTYRLFWGKPDLDGLPSARLNHQKEAATLEIILVDEQQTLAYHLYYTIYRDFAMISRHVVVANLGTEPIWLTKVASMQLDCLHENWQVLTLPGAHANERHMQISPLSYGVHNFESTRGTSSHQMNSAYALVTPQTTATNGKAVGFVLVYSGNHQGQFEVDQIDQLRVNIGINPHNFSWQLAPGKTFTTPEVLVSASDNGLNSLSHHFHDFINQRLVNANFAQKLRPIVVNNWEATYFDFDEAKLVPLVDAAKKLGVETFVLDDGWFGKRNDDKSSLGDWVVDNAKFKHGLGHFVDYVHHQGLQFGLWFEPEMISKKSELYNNHPEWLMHAPNQTPNPSRDQYVLDLTQKQVQDNIIEQVSAILQTYQIDYVKWDMNRHLSDVYAYNLPASQQGEANHRYVLGLYRILQTLTQRFDKVLFEGCSGGGGRFDAGMLAYFPQIWTSDNTDAYARLAIQAGTSLFYPQSTISAHFSTTPNHQTERTTPAKTRYLVARNAVFGYELDLSQLTEKDQQQVKRQITAYKNDRKLLQFGQFSRLDAPKNHTAWQTTSRDQRHVIVSVVRHLAAAQAPCCKLYLQGLLPEAKYVLKEDGRIFSGSELMQLGMYLPMDKGDFVAFDYHFDVVE